MDFADWLKAKGIEYPNLGVNWPAGNSWGAADFLSTAYRQYSDERREFLEILEWAMEQPVMSAEDMIASA